MDELTKAELARIRDEDQRQNRRIELLEDMSKVIQDLVLSIHGLAKDMEQMLDYIDTLNELDTTGIEPMSHVFPVQNVFREDVVTNGDNKEATLANAPLRKEDSFEVPKTIG